MCDSEISHFLEPEDRDEEDDEQEADLKPIEVCRYCGASECTGTCENVPGLNAP